MSLVRSTSISVDEGEEMGKIYFFEPGDMNCVCVPFRGLNWQDKRLQCL
jgi:hypothetical protein